MKPSEPISIQLIINRDKLDLFNGFIEQLSKFCSDNYSGNGFFYNLSDVYDSSRNTTNFLRVKLYIINDSSMVNFVNEWIDERLDDLNLSENDHIYESDFKRYTEGESCSICGGTGRISKERTPEKCTCKNGYINTRISCPSCRGKGTVFLSLIRCTCCQGKGYLYYKKKCSKCSGSGIYKPSEPLDIECPNCKGKGYLLE